MFAITSMSDFSTSAGVLSGHVAFLLLICMLANPISSIVGGVTYTAGLRMLLLSLLDLVGLVYSAAFKSVLPTFYADLGPQ